MPPTATAVVSSPNPTAFMPSRWLAYSTSTDQAAPNVTLNVKIVRASVRIGGCASSQRIPSPISVRRFETTRGSLLLARDDARHEQRTEHETHGIRGERKRHPGGEQERADRRRNQLIGQQERALHPGVGEHQVLPGHETRQQRAAGRVGERLRGPEDEERDQDDSDAHGPADDRRDEDDQRERAAEVDDDDHAAPVEAVRSGAAEDAEDQGREVLTEDRHRDEERVARLGGHQQRPGRQHDAVAGVVDERCGQEPAEAPSEPRWNDDLGRPREQGSHPRQDTNRDVGRGGSSASMGLGSRP